MSFYKIIPATEVSIIQNSKEYKSYQLYGKIKSGYDFDDLPQLHNVKLTDHELDVLADYWEKQMEIK